MESLKDRVIVGVLNRLMKALDGHPTVQLVVGVIAEHEFGHAHSLYYDRKSCRFAWYATPPAETPTK